MNSEQDEVREVKARCPWSLLGTGQCALEEGHDGYHDYSPKPASPQPAQPETIEVQELAGAVRRPNLSNFYCTRNGKQYVRWEYAGGPDQCKHGYAACFVCPECEAQPAQKDFVGKARFVSTPAAKFDPTLEPKAQKQAEEMTDAELDAEIRANGLDPHELNEKMLTRIKQAKAEGKSTPRLDEAEAAFERIVEAQKQGDGDERIRKISGLLDELRAANQKIAELEAKIASQPAPVGFEEFWSAYRDGMKLDRSLGGYWFVLDAAQRSWQAALKSQPAVEALVSDEWIEVMLGMDGPDTPLTQAFRELKSYRRSGKGQDSE